MASVSLHLPSVCADSETASHEDWYDLSSSLHLRRVGANRLDTLIQGTKIILSHLTLFRMEPTFFSLKLHMDCNNPTH
jgi:hypothetical protein